MQLDNTGLSHSRADRYFQQLAQAISDLIILADPSNLQIKFINHLPPYIQASEAQDQDCVEVVRKMGIVLSRTFLSVLARSGENTVLELESEEGSTLSGGKTWHTCSGSVLRDSEGKIEHLLLVFKNISASKLHDMEIRNKEEKLYAILNNTSDIILSVDRDYRLTEYNSVFSTMIEQGFGKKNLSGTSVLDYLDPKKHTHLINIYEKVFQGEIANDIESYDTISGLTVYHETSYHPIYNFEEEITGISIFSKNITERVLNEQKLKNTLREKEVLLSEIHHRIKNNLALVSSMLQLKEMNISHEAAKEALSDSRKRIKSTALVHEMLYRNDTFDRVQLFEYLTELFNSLNVNAQVSLMLEGDNAVFDLSKALPFGLMMHELMMNSFKHSFQQGKPQKLSIASRTNSGMLQLEYCDEGGKFPENVNFMDTASTGLMLIHTFIEQLSGTIQLSSKTPTRYAIQIPLA